MLFSNYLLGVCIIVLSSTGGKICADQPRQTQGDQDEMDKRYCENLGYYPRENGTEIERRTFLNHQYVETNCQTQDAPADIVFLLDSSGSVGATNFKVLLQFIKNIVSRLNIGQDAAQISLVTFSSTPTCQISFKDRQDRGSLIHALGRVVYHRGGTDTAAALRFARLNSFTEKNGARPDAAKIAIVITDGISYQPQQTAKEAKNLRDSGVTVFAIGMNNAKLMELNAIASDPDASHVFQSSNFDVLDTIKDKLTNEVCKSFTKKPERSREGNLRYELQECQRRLQEAASSKYQDVQGNNEGYYSGSIMELLKRKIDDLTHRINECEQADRSQQCQNQVEKYKNMYKQQLQENRQQNAVLENLQSKFRTQQKKCNYGYYRYGRNEDAKRYPIPYPSPSYPSPTPINCKPNTVKCRSDRNCGHNEICFPLTKTCVCDIKSFRLGANCVPVANNGCHPDAPTYRTSQVSLFFHSNPVGKATIKPYCSASAIHDHKGKISLGKYVSGDGWHSRPQVFENGDMVDQCGPHLNKNRNVKSTLEYVCYCHMYEGENSPCVKDPESITAETYKLEAGEWKRCMFFFTLYTPLACSTEDLLDKGYARSGTLPLNDGFFD